MIVFEFLRVMYYSFYDLMKKFLANDILKLHENVQELNKFSIELKYEFYFSTFFLDFSFKKKKQTNKNPNYFDLKTGAIKIQIKPN